MKKTIISAVIMSVSTSVSAGFEGLHLNGRVSFSGSIINAPCTISPDSVDQTVNMGTLSSLDIQYDKIQSRSFSINFESCNPTTATSSTITFDGIRSDEAPNFGLALQGIHGAQLRLFYHHLNGAIYNLRLGTPIAIDLKSGNNKLEYIAEIIRSSGSTAPIETGRYTVTANFIVSYE